LREKQHVDGLIVKTYTVDGDAVDNLSYSINEAAEQLKSYVLKELSVAAYDEYGHPLNKLGHLPQ
jgi:hypothetical protein